MYYKIKQKHCPSSISLNFDQCPNVQSLVSGKKLLPDSSNCDNCSKNLWEYSDAISIEQIENMNLCFPCKFYVRNFHMQRSVRPLSVCDDEEEEPNIASEEKIKQKCFLNTAESAEERKPNQTKQNGIKQWKNALIVPSNGPKIESEAIDDTFLENRIKYKLDLAFFPRLSPTKKRPINPIRKATTKDAEVGNNNSKQQ